MLDLLRDLMDTAAGRCSYADVRRVDRMTERVSTLNGAVEGIEDFESDGIGIRVRAGSGWGFAATSDVSRAGAERTLRRALALAESQPLGRAGPLAPAPPAAGRWDGPCAKDPFAVSPEQKLSLLLDADEAMRGDGRIVRTHGHVMLRRAVQAFASSEGATYEQTMTECGGGIAVFALQDGELQERSYPGGHGGDVAAAGWEHVESLDLVGAAPRIAEEAVELLSAPPCPEGVTTVVLGPDQLALQLHESIGHALELDRMLGIEAAYAGTSWVSPQDLGHARYGSDLLHVTADATLPGALGSFGWDDEGVPGQRQALIQEGVLRGALSSRESAAAAGLAGSSGCMRADGFTRQPLVRMTNVSIEPGQAGSLEELVADTGEGLFLETNRSWSIDDRRLQFQFATEVGREIRGGRLGRLYRNPSYAGLTPHFWGSMDAACSASEWRLHGLVNCGKGEPGQVMHVSHGAVPARFRDVQVGVA